MTKIKIIYIGIIMHLIILMFLFQIFIETFNQLESFRGIHFTLLQDEKKSLELNL